MATDDQTEAQARRNRVFEAWERGSTEDKPSPALAIDERLDLILDGLNQAVQEADLEDYTTPSAGIDPVEGAVAIGPYFLEVRETGEVNAQVCAHPARCDGYLYPWVDEDTICHIVWFYASDVFSRNQPPEKDLEVTLTWDDPYLTGKTTHGWTRLIERAGDLDVLDRCEKRGDIVHGLKTWAECRPWWSSTTVTYEPVIVPAGGMGLEIGSNRVVVAPATDPLGDDFDGWDVTWADIRDWADSDYEWAWSTNSMRALVDEIMTFAMLERNAQ